MNNVIKFLVYLLVVLLLVSWLITVGKSCSTTETNPPQTMDVIQDRTDSATDLMEEMESPDFTEELESILDEEEATLEEDNTSTTINPAAKIDDHNDSKLATPTTSKPMAEEVVEKTPPPAQPEPKSSTSVGTGKFLVIAGSYIHPDNADQQSTRLANKGYAAEVVSFELSEYHTVLAGRFDSYDAAQNTVNRLSRDGFDAYVKRRTR